MHPDPLFTVFGQGVYLYGICFALGVIACFAFLIFTMWYKNFSETSSSAILFIGIFATAFGALSGMVVQGIYDVIDGKDFSLSGMTFIGGLIGGVVSFLAVWNLYMFVIRPRTKIKWLNGAMNATLCDALPFIPIGIAIAHALGRFGCFWAGCCYGKPAEWGIACAHGYNGDLKMNMDGVKVIPTQLFEMSFLIVLAAVMAFLYFRYKFNYNFAVYSVAYGIFRFTIEFFRADYRGKFIGSVTPSQFWGIVMVLIGVAYVFAQYYLFSKLMKNPESRKLFAKATAAETSAEGSEDVEEIGSDYDVEQVKKETDKKENE